MLTADEYKVKLKRLDELQDIDDWDDRCDEFNCLLDMIIEYDNENNIYIPRN